MDYEELLDWLYSTQLFGVKLGLEGPRQLLRRFKAYPAPEVKVVHVAGTNGKGSTCAIAESLARSCGMKTGLFTSPHLVDFRERIRVNGEMIPVEDLTVLLRELHDKVSALDPHPTFFELTLALALRYFREKKVEIIFLETGMGGRLDATNAVKKDIAVLTPIGMDHMQYLGNTLEQIAEEKADIIQEDTPVVTAPQHPEVMEVIEQVSIERRAKLIRISQPLHGYYIALPGKHQQENAALAAAALHEAGLELRADTVAEGLKKVRWPGRFEKIGTDYILDGAHNAHATPALISTWREEFGNAKAPVVFAAVGDKDVTTVLEEISSIAHSFHFAPLNSPRALPPEEASSALPSSFSGKIYNHTTLEDALSTARQEASSLDIPVLVTGSLYFIGEVKAFLEGKNSRITSQ